MKNTSMAVAETILAQLGGTRFLAMTGAKNLTGDADSLTFKLPRGCKDGINAVKIRLMVDDTYTITFYKQLRAPSFAVTTVREQDMVYADSLRAVFTSATGLETTLGTLGARG